MSLKERIEELERSLLGKSDGDAVSTLRDAFKEYGAKNPCALEERITILERRCTKLNDNNTKIIAKVQELVTRIGVVEFTVSGGNA